MVNFSKRVFLVSLYNEWLCNADPKYTIEDSPVSMITFLYTNGMLNEDMVNEYISNFRIERINQEAPEKI